MILAGGAGERLRPLTELMPKPMAPVNGETFILKLINQLVENRYDDVFILAGYKSEIILYYINYLNLGLNVKVISTPEFYSPRQRLIASRAEIGDNFILLYGDNYIENFQEFISFESVNFPISLLVEKRVEGNVKFHLDDEIRYRSSERYKEYDFVDLGYIQINTPKFFRELEKASDLNVAIENLSNRGLVGAGKVKTGSNLSISNLSRFNQVNKNRKKILIDRDGVINKKMPARTYVSSFEEYQILEENWLGLEKLSKLGCDFIMITNQPGISTGQVDLEFLKELHERIYLEFLKRNINLYAIYVCPHHWDHNCLCRKPKPGMLNSALKDFNLRNDETLYIGDETKDKEAARSALVEFVHVNAELNLNCDSINQSVRSILKIL